VGGEKRIHTPWTPEVTIEGGGALGQFLWDYSTNCGTGQNLKFRRINKTLKLREGLYR